MKIQHLRMRIAHVWDGFRNAPLDKFYVVQDMGVIGLRILSQHYTYADAYDRFVERSDRGDRIVTESEWQRRTIALWSQPRVWREMANLSALVQQQSEQIADLEAIQKSRQAADYVTNRTQ